MRTLNILLFVALMLSSTLCGRLRSSAKNNDDYINIGVKWAHEFADVTHAFAAHMWEQIPAQKTADGVKIEDFVNALKKIFDNVDEAMKHPLFQVADMDQNGYVDLKEAETLFSNIIGFIGAHVALGKGEFHAKQSPFSEGIEKLVAETVKRLKESYGAYEKIHNAHAGTSGKVNTETYLKMLNLPNNDQELNNFMKEINPKGKENINKDDGYKASLVIVFKIYTRQLGH